MNDDYQDLLEGWVLMLDLFFLIPMNTENTQEQPNYAR